MLIYGHLISYLRKMKLAKYLRIYWVSSIGKFVAQVKFYLKIMLSSKFLGNPCGDIARLLGLNTSAVYRRNNTERILHKYLEKVTKFMNGRPVFTYEQVMLKIQVEGGIRSI